MCDRLLGGVFCVILLLSFVVQIAGASRAAASMVSPDPLSIVCSAGDGTHGPTKTDPSKPCPCGDLCGAGVQFGSLPRPADMSGIPIRFADRIEISVDHAAPPTALAPARTYEARGPPYLST